MFFKPLHFGTLYCLLSQAHGLSASDPNMVNIKNLRVAYNDFSKQLLESNINMAEPFSNFQEWLNSAIESKVEEPNAMNIATVDERGRPSSRLVLCKEVRKGEGLVFFTHGTSRKGQCLAKNPYIAATFFWPEVHRQIRIEGITEILPEDVAEEYFNSRSKESRAASACSDQSKVIASKPELMEKYEKMMEEEEPKRPEAWRGYLIKPDYFEFWQGNSHRLHDRIVFQKDSSKDGEWKTERIQP